MMAAAAATNPIDKHIGQRIRLRRLSVAMTQKQLADRLGVSFQEVQKYEKGIDRVSCARLNQIADALQEAPGAFFPTKAGESTNANGVVSTDEFTKLIDRPDTIRLLRAWKGVRDRKRRIMVIEFVEAIRRRPL